MINRKILSYGDRRTRIHQSQSSTALRAAVPRADLPTGLRLWLITYRPTDRGLKTIGTPYCHSPSGRAGEGRYPWRESEVASFMLKQKREYAFGIFPRIINKNDELILEQCFVSDINHFAK